ncbi:tyrosine-type recombinase/integrase [Halopseudomonas nanhaiensis]|nr:integrase arm-type DNA-binding domain-containing protein [Halopseudomonas nanhaiensis]UAW99964.1 tyrosine-type recombinase/integrase [Halopseudomonas nanhaiensis]
MALTDSAIRTAKPKTKIYRLADANGLCLEVTPSGSKLWRYRYRFAGKAKMMALGAYPAVTLLKARQRRDAARQTLSEGIDPSEQKKATKIANKLEGITFEVLAREWFEYNAPRWAESTRSKALHYLERDLLPTIGSRQVRAVTRPELVELVRTVEARGALNVARKVRQWLHQIFRFGLASGVVEANPATDLDVVAAPPKDRRHHPNVSFSELPELLARIDTTRLNTLTRLAIRLLLLTAVRPGELRAAPWAEFDLDAATWTIPKERMKARRSHVVPLPAQAVAILRELKEITGAYRLVFPGQNDSSRPMSENTINKALRVMGYEGRQTGHGFRHLLSTELNGLGFNRDWIERQLAHGDSDGIRDTYNHANYLEQRRGMMQAWADSIDAACERNNIVTIKQRAHG